MQDTRHRRVFFLAYIYSSRSSVSVFNYYYYILGAASEEELSKKNLQCCEEISHGIESHKEAVRTWAAHPTLQCKVRQK